jgi:hypothetical protein
MRATKSGLSRSGRRRGRLRLGRFRVAVALVLGFGWRLGAGAGPAAARCIWYRGELNMISPLRLQVTTGLDCRDQIAGPNPGK